MYNGWLFSPTPVALASPSLAPSSALLDAYRRPRSATETTTTQCVLVQKITYDPPLGSIPAVSIDSMDEEPPNSMIAPASTMKQYNRHSD